VSSELATGSTGTDLPLDIHYSWHARLKFQHRYWLHLLLFLITLATTTFAGALAYGGFEESVGIVRHTPLLSLGFFAQGLWYSLPVLLILGAHEFGHYVLCRVHDVDATLPYFIPAPPIVLITGTFGAVIRIREAFPSKKALFDIGVAGPIAGFLMLLPMLFWGVSLSQLVPVTHGGDMIYFGEPLLYKFAAWLHFGSVPTGYDVSIHPMAFAAWWGMLATALNLMPFGQLDGGHVLYSVMKRPRQAAIASVVTLVAAALLTTRSLSWISMLVIMVLMALFLGLQHPRVIDEDTPLDPGRRLLAVFALVMFILCFTPVPIQTFIGK
jgi:membrane-associated protease RseP (regulator of RpoE activity)